jgi:sulfur relay protein TusB/DsrH
MAKILYFITDRDSLGLQLAIEHEDQEVGICLLQDAVYFAHSTESRNKLVKAAIKRSIPIFAAKRDIQLRGLTTLILPDVHLLDYEEIIDLVFDYDQIINL